ncbi:hypothetical protein EZI54_12020 [Marinobacter halodurans]|uniref:DUF1127 domain-containing protein n=1 Tax=Marinobacter halodurans TaxID=2528979 RepID=A0ABY1ZJY2_9GAMM|nr:hypothetical protein [Marinobacter halodurans]TBW55175.1 hypothetical protein EZI54_12020 [Marinobacter halodurans]
MNRSKQSVDKRTESTGRQMPEFYMPAMPPVALTEEMDHWYRLWRRRRHLRQLLVLDDAALEALGLKREDLEWATHRPWREDAFEALRERREHAH